MPAQTTDRGREIARIRRLIERLHAPRLQMALIVALTGAVGLLASFALLHAGVDSLWLRYPVAVALAYLAFLLFLWFWLRLRSADLLDFLQIDTSDGLFDDREVTQFSFPGSGVPDGGVTFDLDELGVVLVAAVALVGAACAAVWMVWTAPTLLAELLLDVVLSAGLYRRIRAVKGDHWLRTAIRRTAWPFVAVALLFALAGGVMQAYAPSAKSVGEVIRYYKDVR